MYYGGEGAYSTVRKVIHRKTKNVRAMKIIKKSHLTSDEQKSKFVNEIEILRQLDHPHILKLFEFYQDHDNYYIIVEMATGGELFQKIKEKGVFSEKEASVVMYQILLAVVYAHNSNIVHRDLKPQNILLDTTKEGNSYIKVVDWGTSKFFEKGKSMTEVFGTAYYIAPDVLKRQYNEKCDIWSCGVILYILLSGGPPINGKSQQDIIQNIQKGTTINYNGQAWSNISQSAVDILKKMLEYKQDQRWSATQCLEHKWFYEMGVKSKEQKATLTFIASQLTSKEEKYMLADTFKKIDKNGDGVLSKEEIVNGFMQELQMTKSEAEAQANIIFETVDIDKSGQIDYHEFIVATMNQEKALTKDKIQQSFSLFDQDGDGQITVKELQKVLGKHIPKKQLEIILQEVDTNGDGVISIEEFTELMNNNEQII
ncbi:Protein kinase-like domain [Pseudocohnilembus persalinus]|uniref:non-specific serine/threonine protein kinase n=1 Tax=Pseudocohnilembus persalinus TaxID=266149 RepID=A0A0V0QH26_PSEPJ|nr:Protein kinase-like domain [Pseudocohnilembus persalinus]|eukprot:KRX01424.1 Protein kinase-like domain [Pseudocohnilembus persalinus]